MTGSAKASQPRDPWAAAALMVALVSATGASTPASPLSRGIPVGSGSRSPACPSLSWAVFSPLNRAGTPHY